MKRNIKLNSCIIIVTIVTLIMIILPKKTIATSKRLLGDINGDQTINSSDMLYILRHISETTNNNHSEWILTDQKLELADLDEDGEIDSKDLLIMIRYILAINNDEVKKSHPKWIELREVEIDERDDKALISTSEENLKKQTKLGSSGDILTDELDNVLKKDNNEETISDNEIISEAEMNQKSDTKTEDGQEQGQEQGQETETIIEPKTIEVTAIKLNSNSIELEKGKSKTIEVTIEPENATNKEVTFSSNNVKIAKVDDTGKVTALKTGIATITAKSSNDKEVKCIIKVIKKATGININKTNIEMNIAQKTDLVANLTPFDATNGTITWKSSDTSIIGIERKVENGTYIIQSALDKNIVVDISGGSKENKAKVQLYNKNGTDAQKFDIISKNNGYYIIKAKHSGLAIDLTGGKTTNGTKIQQYKLNGSNAQQWCFEDAGGGYYYIRSKLGEKYLDINNGKAKKGTQLQIWTGNRTKAQKFKLELVEKKKKVVEEGTYYIKSALNQNQVIDISKDNKSKVQLYELNNGENQKFEIISAGDGYYIIATKFGSKVLDVTSAQKVKGTKIQQWNINGSNAQLWKFENAGNGYYYIKSKLGEFYLDASDGQSKNGTQLQIWTGNKTLAQKFKLESVEEEINTNKIERISIRGKKTGTTTIVATASNGKTVKCKVTVKYSYVEHMKKKIEYYDSSTNYGCTVDVDKCKLCIFKKVDNQWQHIATWNTVQGVNNHSRISDWYGPRSHTFKGVYKIKGKWNGTTVILADRPVSQMKTGLEAQKIETCPWGNPETMPLSKRFKSLGCTQLTKEHVKWIHDNVPTRSTIIVFDKYNPMPKWEEWDRKPSVSKPKSKDISL